MTRHCRESRRKADTEFQYWPRIVDTDIDCGPRFCAPCSLRAQRLKKFKIALWDWNFQARLKVSSEPPTKPRFLWGILQVGIENFKRDWKFQASLISFKIRALWVSETPNRREFKGNRIGATGLRASERKSASERVSEWEGFQRFLRGFERFLEVFRDFERFSEVFRGFERFFRGFQRFVRGFQRSSQRPSQRQISLSEALSPVAPNRVAPWTFANLSYGSGRCGFGQLRWVRPRTPSFITGALCGAACTEIARCLPFAI